LAGSKAKTNGNKTKKRENGLNLNWAVEVVKQRTAKKAVGREP